MTLALVATLACQVSCDDKEGQNLSGAAGEMGGLAGAAGEGGATGGTTNGVEPSFAVMGCVSPTPSNEVTVGMTVVGEAEPDLTGCAEPGYAYPPEAVTRGLPLLPWSAVLLEDEEGQTYKVQFALGELPTELFVPGDTVSLEAGRSSSYPPPPTGTFLGIIRDQRPLAFVSWSSIPAWDGIRIEPAVPDCTDESLRGKFVPMRVTANGEEAELDTGESKEVGGLLFRNAFFQSKTPCGGTDGFTVSRLFGGYKLP